MLQGERDYQVTMEDFNLWKDNFANDDNWEFKSYTKLNHLMMAGDGKSSGAKYVIKGDVSSELIQDIVDWMESVE